MPRVIRSALCLTVACAAVNFTTSVSLGATPTTQPIGKDDAILGLSVTNAYQSVKHIKANFSTKDSGTVTGTSWNQSFIQSVEFDNLNGLRHNAQGNLLGVDFGTTAGGGYIVSMGTHPITAGQTGQVASTLLYTFDGTGTASSTAHAPELGRIGGISVAPNNARIAVSSNEMRAAGAATTAGLGKVSILDYTAGDGTGTGGSLTNYRSIEIPGLRTGTTSRTSSTAWLDSKNVMVVGGTTDLSSTGDLYKVSVANDGSLSSSLVSANLFQGFNLTFTNVTYEPTVSPYVFVSGSGFSGGTINKLIAVDPANNFTPVTGLLDFSPSVTTQAPDGQINTLREVAFDSKGNLVMGAFAGSTAQSNDYVIKSLTNAINVGALTDQSTSLVGILQKQQTSDAASTATPPILGTSSSFNGLDVALTNIDYVNADVNVNIGTGDYTQQYFGATSPQAQLIAKLKAGTITGTAAAGRGVGYVVTPSASGGTFRVVYTVLGDASLDKTVNFTDLVALAQNYNGTGKVWTQGDFNYDGIVNFGDLVILAQNYNQTLTPALIADAGLSSSFLSDWNLAVSLAPEPVSLTALAGLAIVGGRRRRVI